MNKCDKCGEVWRLTTRPYRVNGTLRSLHDECAKNLERDHTVRKVV